MLLRKAIPKSLRNPDDIKMATERKEMKFKQLPNGLYALYWEGGGEVPDTLSGLYTSIHMIERALDNFYREKRRNVFLSKGKKD